MRLCPLVPFNAYNYIMGGTNIEFKNYFLTFPGTLPVAAVNVFVGTTIIEIKDVVNGDYNGGTASLVLLIVGCVLTVLITIYVTLLIRRNLKAMAAKANEEKLEE